MKFECINCGKILSTLDSRNGEVVISYQTGEFGNIIGWRIECEICYSSRKMREEQEEEERIERGKNR